MEAVTTYDFADRPASLVARRFGVPDTAASYLPSGPLSSLTLGNELTETRTFNARYFPSSISAGGLLSWSYSTDGVGNIRSITDTLNAANNRTYGYQDHQYFLTRGNGPWGPRAWSYDKIGNRLTETRGTATDTYSYLTNGTGGNTPQIDQILPRTGPVMPYRYDEVGNLLENGITTFTYGEDRRLARLGKPGGPTFTFDGRGYLSRSKAPLPATYFTDDTVPTYSSEGLLLHRHARRNVLSGTTVSSVRDSNLYIFYFAGRPVATLDKVTEGPPVLEFTATWALSYLTVDHLGTPILVTNPSGAQIWQGGFEPFGADYNSVPTILRFPGQWSDTIWDGGGDGGLYYNVHRWYEARQGRYTQPDPLGINGGGNNLYLYAGADPLQHVDPNGLFIPRPCGPQDTANCQNDCQQHATGPKRYAGCNCFRIPFCGGLFNYSVAICKDWQRGCPPCPPPPPPDIDRVPPSRPHFPCKGDHWVFFKYDQGPPPQCICRRRRIFGGCL
jgi:RHS repeat-associated protein